MSELLFFNLVVSEDVTEWIAFASTLLIALLIVAVVILIGKKKLATVDIAYAGVALSISFVLSFIKVTPVQYGGAITLASFAPILIYAYYFGVGKALVCGMVYGLLQFIQSPYVLTPVTFALDYLLAFSCIFVMGFFKGKKLNSVVIVCGTSGSLLFRFIMHFISGIVYFNHGAIWADLPDDSAVLYSLLYQTVYVIPDLVICLAVMLILYKTRVIERIKPKNATI